jgi:hypothetical protein
VQEVTRSKRTGDQRGDPSTVGGLYAHIVANMHEYIGVTHRNKGELAEIRVRCEVLEGV